MRSAAVRLTRGSLSNRKAFGGLGQLVSRITGCAVKGGGPQRELNPPGNWFAPPGSNRSSSGGNEAAEAFGVEGRIGDLASVQAVT
jgi:hypothetical protein